MKYIKKCRLNKLYISAFLLSFGTMLFSLLLSASVVYSGVECEKLFWSYFDKPILLLLNLIPILLLYLFFTLLTGKAWIGFLSSYVICIGISLVNYFKISLRSEPLLAEDIRLALEAGNILSNYTLECNPIIGFALVYFVVGLTVAVLMAMDRIKSKQRLLGIIICAALGVILQGTVYMNDEVYNRINNNDYIIEYNPVENYISKGCVYSFLYSVKDAHHTPPEGYEKKIVQNIYDSYEDVDIPDEKKVSVIMVMLEAFCDLTDYPELSKYGKVADVYKPWHELEMRSLYGDLITDAFAGNTVYTERSVLTGDNTLIESRGKTASYVWYIKNQGYSTFGYHPYYDWFYNRRNENAYLGFDEYEFFDEMWEADEKEIWTAFWDSDRHLTEKILEHSEEQLKKGPFFSLSVSVQNHGPYETAYDRGKTYITPEETGFSQETCSIFNNYLFGLEDTIAVFSDFVEEISRKNEPIVICLFGDHKPWGGNGNSAYQEAGISFDLSTLEGIYNYYSTPYLIWANDSAKTVLNKEFLGVGRDISPCFLMTELFDQCGWTGPGFMQFSRKLKDISPVIHSNGFFIVDGKLCSELPEDKKEQYNQHIQVQYYRRNRKYE